MMFKKYYAETQRYEGTQRRAFVNRPTQSRRIPPNIVSNEDREAAKTNVLYAENPKRRKI